MKDRNSVRVKLFLRLGCPSPASSRILLESSVTNRREKKAVCRDLLNLKNLNLKELIKMGGSVLQGDRRV